VSARDRIVVGALVAVAALAGFWFFVLSPKREAVSAAQGRVTAQQERLDQANALLATAQGAKKRFGADYAAVAGLGKAVPADDNVASLVYELQSVAADAKITFRGVKVMASSTTTPAPAAAAASASASGASATAGGAGTTAAPATQVAASKLPPGAVVGTAGLVTMPFSFVFQGGFLDMQRFLARLDGFVRVRGGTVLVSGRLLSVDGISLTKAPKGNRVTATIAATAYLSPDDSVAGPSAAAGGATPSTTPGTGTTAAPGTGTTTAIPPAS